jgi:hypothetical protein
MITHNVIVLTKVTAGFSITILHIILPGNNVKGILRIRDNFKRIAATQTSGCRGFLEEVCTKTSHKSHNTCLKYNTAYAASSVTAENLSRDSRQISGILMHVFQKTEDTIHMFCNH